jgi:hypothetical protein
LVVLLGDPYISITAEEHYVRAAEGKQMRPAMALFLIALFLFGIVLPFMVATSSRGSLDFATTSFIVILILIVGGYLIWRRKR